MFPSRNVEEVVSAIYELLEPEVRTDDCPSALAAVFIDDDRSGLRLRVAHLDRLRWFRLRVEEFDPTVRPPGLSVPLLPSSKR